VLNPVPSIDGASECIGREFIKYTTTHEHSCLLIGVARRILASVNTITCQVLICEAGDRTPGIHKGRNCESIPLVGYRTRLGKVNVLHCPMEKSLKPKAQRWDAHDSQLQ
jgi:hypothetical protein